MKRLQAFAFVVGVLGMHFHAAGAEDPAESTSHSTAKSPLAADGELQQLREPLARIFQFKLDAGNLKFDRTAWESAAAEIEKKNAAAKEAEQLPPGMDPESPAGLRYRARLLQERALLLERQQRMGSLPPFMTLFENFEEQSRHGQRSTGGATGYSTIGKMKTFRRTFEGKTLVGEARSDNDGDWFTVRELESPNRTLELSSENGAGFRIELSDPSGNLILLRQRRDSFSAVDILAGKVQFVEGTSFVDACRRNRTKMETDLLPILTSIGICPELSPGEMEGAARTANQNVSWADSQLLGKAALEEYRESLANIFKYRVVDGQLKIDREAWKQTADSNQKRIRRCRRSRQSPSGTRAAKPAGRAANAASADRASTRAAKFANTRAATGIDLRKNQGTSPTVLARFRQRRASRRRRCRSGALAIVVHRRCA